MDYIRYGSPTSTTKHGVKELTNGAEYNTYIGNTILGVSSAGMNISENSTDVGNIIP